MWALIDGAHRNHCVVMTMELVAISAAETDLVFRVARPRSIRDRLVLKATEGSFRENVTRDSATLIELATTAARERAARGASEPHVPVSTGRHLSEPLSLDLRPSTRLPRR